MGEIVHGKGGYLLMEYFFTHKVGVCAYVECYQPLQIKRWIARLRRRGFGCFYLYLAEGEEAVRRELKDELLAGIVVIVGLIANGSDGTRDMVYDDCIKRTRYACKYLALLRVGDYLEGLGELRFDEAVERLFDAATGVVELECREGGTRHVVNPFLLKRIENGNFVGFPEGHGRNVSGVYVTRKRRKCIALFSHVMARNGAPLALLGVAKILKEAGYEVDVYSSMPGPLEEDFAALGISVTFDPLFRERPMAGQSVYYAYDLLFANTAVIAGCFQETMRDVPVIWWLHESRSILSWCKLDERNFSELSSDNITTLGVSSIAVRDFKAIAPEWPVAGILTLGMDDIFAGRRDSKTENEKFVFMMAGTLEERKGQDVFLKAVGLLPEEQRKRCRFWVIGSTGYSTGEGYDREITALAAQYPEVKLLKARPREELLALYQQADAVVVPSREETLSMIALEAMMMAVPCILSDGTGAAYFIQDEVSGLTFHNGEAENLSAAMSYLLTDRLRAEKMGAAGRRVFEENFSKEIFARNLLGWVEKCIGRRDDYISLQ